MNNGGVTVAIVGAGAADCLPAERDRSGHRGQQVHALQRRVLLRHLRRRELLFFDAGQAYAEGEGFYWKTMRNSTGAEIRFQMPVLNVPFRLIYAINPTKDTFQPRTAFKFAVGTTF